jgi:Rps23 Pro-64 3,4-dihydroxylase Tpa1-like proline 4-hydroxylase
MNINICLYLYYMENYNIFDIVHINKNSISRELCSDMINLFSQEKNRYPGSTLGGVNLNVKDTTDFKITDAGPNWDKINKVLSKELTNNVTEYVKKCDNIVGPGYSTFGGCDLTSYEMQIQKYEKNVGKYIYHEDGLCDFNNRKIRKITFLWYLNDVTEGGETEFLSKYRITPEVGKLILFPANWTFPHKGKVPLSNDKYIITGWLWQSYDK